MFASTEALYSVEGQTSDTVRDIHVTAYYWRFDPSTIAVNENDAVRLTVTSISNMMPMMAYMFPNHGIEIEDYELDYTLPVGETVTIEFVANKSGTFHFHCSIYCGMGHEDMHGELIVNGDDSDPTHPSGNRNVLEGPESWGFLPPLLFVATILAVGYILLSKRSGQASGMTITDEKPVVAFTLSVIGIALQVVAGIFMISTMLYTPFSGPWMMWGEMSSSLTWSGGGAEMWTVLATMMALVGILGVLWMNSSHPYRVRTGATLVLIAAVLAFPTMWGFMVGSLLMFIGGTLGLIWQPNRKE